MSEPLTDVEIEGVMRYWEQPTGMANAPGGMVEAARSNLASFKATIDTLTAERDRYRVALERIVAPGYSGNTAGYDEGCGDCQECSAEGVARTALTTEPEVDE